MRNRLRGGDRPRSGLEDLDEPDEPARVLRVDGRGGSGGKGLRARDERPRAFAREERLELRAAAEQGACEGKLQLAKRAKELNYDAVHDTVHEMAKDEARHGAGFEGLLKRYFK